ncbi:integrase, catalytic region, zinc finger, CCHC-type containing protein [Tanacetum coccineum]|uniref:Integrase, catalytic region, zinc finger, CCHC-type containing protein n=1 Tax=Tanacetum coccineum TaxID=301880 RepID=A0ABQ4WND9_9ASTR
MNVKDTEDILDDATKSQIKMKKKSQDPISIKKKQNDWTTDYKKLNALYKDFVPREEFSAEQKYFSSSFISSENSSKASSPSSSSETKSTVTPMPSANLMLVDLNQMENDFKTLFELLQTNSKRESIFYTSPEEIRLTNFCQQKVKPILHKLHLNFEIFQKQFLKDIKEMKDVFVSTENDLSETWKQNELLKDQLLEAKLKHEIECCVLLSYECVDNKMHNEIEKIQRDSIEIQEGMQKRINILENDVQRCLKQRLDFELQLQHEKERRKCESSLKNICETSWISKMEKLERLRAISSVRRPSNRDSSFKNSVLSNTKNSSEKVEVSDRSNKTSDVASKNVALNKKIVTNDDIKNALIAKNVLDRELNLYTISISDMAASSPVCLMSKATLTKSWLWRRRLSHLNFGTINDLTKHNLVDGLPKFKYRKDHLCSACKRGKSKKASHPPKVVPCNHSKLELLHMDLCGPMRVASINGKRYILVIVDDYSRFTWVYFLRTKDKTP